MLSKTTINQVIPILKRDTKRALKMRVEGFPSPYYCSFLLRDIEWFNTWASNGAIYRKRSDRKRNVYCDLRVGSYRYDQTSHGGLHDHDEELESYSHIRIPIDDKRHEGLRLGLWRLSESKFREALSDYNQKTAARLTTVDPNRRLQSFTKLKRLTHIKYQNPDVIDESAWVSFLKKASKWMSELPHVSSSWLDFDASQETKVFVSSENRIVVQHTKVFSLIATFQKLTREGVKLEQELVINTATPDQLPDLKTFKKLALKKHAQLVKLLDAKQIHAFSGPVLLFPGPAGLLFHEAIGHRLEGNRLLSSGEGQTFKGQFGKKVLSVNLNISDNPKLKSFKGIKCVGAYDFDDEGSPASNALLVENGVLKDVLTTRAQAYKKNFNSNGHARNAKHQRPISRMGVTIVEAGKSSVSMERLKKMLISEINRQNKPFGMIVYDTAGGETETTAYDFQAFSGQISFATLVYPDGSEECVRGVNFVGTPLQALQNIIAVGNTLEIDNAFCGAESGMIPVTTISPAILLKSLELQSKEEELVTQYLLPRPRIQRTPKKNRRYKTRRRTRR